MGLRSTTAALLGRWYVSAVVAVVAGVAVGYFVFFDVYPGRPQIGIIDVPFVEIDEDSAFVIGEMLDYAREHDEIKAVVVKLVTPGGGSAESEALYHKTLQLRAKKPVIIASGWLNASGGMFMSMGANEIYAQGSSLVGSIGVIFGPITDPDPPDEQLFSSGPAKLIGATNRTFFAMMEMLKESFVQTVVSERGERLRISAEEVSEARLFTGMEAARIGLIDAIGSDGDAIERAATLAGVSNYELVDLNEKVLREFILQFRRIEAASDVESSVFELSDIGLLRSVATAARSTKRSDFPDGGGPPRMYYLYVTPSE